MDSTRGLGSGEGSRGEEGGGRVARLLVGAVMVVARGDRGINSCCNYCITWTLLLLLLVMYLLASPSSECLLVESKNRRGSALLYEVSRVMR